MSFARPALRPVLALLALSVALAGCAPAPTPQGISDPNEAANRRVHAFNKGVDRVILRPTSNVYGQVLPKPVRTGVDNFSSNLSLPGVVVNDLLQANIVDAVHNSFRFALNSTLGVGGLFDPAGSSFGLPERDTDFGETMYVWGVGEGHYLEVPFFGPSTQRDALGLVIDIAANPVGFVLQSPESYISPTARVGKVLGDRYTFKGTIDSLLYESEDSYAQARLLFLDSRRFELSGGSGGEDTYFDPYEDLYAE